MSSHRSGTGRRNVWNSPELCGSEISATHEMWVREEYSLDKHPLIMEEQRVVVPLDDVGEAIGLPRRLSGECY